MKATSYGTASWSGNTTIKTTTRFGMPTVRRTRVGTDRHRMARQLADQHTAHSQRYTSCNPRSHTTSTTRRVARDGALVAADADIAAARRRLCGVHDQATRRMLLVLVQRRTLRTPPCPSTFSTPLVFLQCWPFADPWCGRTA